MYLISRTKIVREVRKGKTRDTGKRKGLEEQNRNQIFTYLSRGKEREKDLF